MCVAQRLTTIPTMKMTSAVKNFGPKRMARSSAVFLTCSIAVSDSGMTTHRLSASPPDHEFLEADVAISLGVGHLEIELAFRA